MAKDATTTKFNYSIPASIEISMPLLRKTLRHVQAQLLSHDINGGGKKLEMACTTNVNTCGMAACIGGWTSLFLLGFDETRDSRLEYPADHLFSALIELDDEHGDSELRSLFHNYADTYNYDTPNVAATAIQRYLTGKEPWPVGEMPNLMPYTKRQPKPVALNALTRKSKRPAKKK